MKVGHAKISGEDMNKEMGEEINGCCAIEGERRREHRKTWRMKERERERGREDGEEARAEGGGQSRWGQQEETSAG